MSRAISNSATTPAAKNTPIASSSEHRQMTIDKLHYASVFWVSDYWHYVDTVSVPSVADGGKFDGVGREDVNKIDWVNPV